MADSKNWRSCAAFCRANAGFFVQVAGRRRIGKTSLIQQALKQTGRVLTLYIQIPDSDPISVLAACND